MSDEAPKGYQPVVVTIRESATGIEREHRTTLPIFDDGPFTWGWEEGNESCDCCRRQFFLGVDFLEKSPCGDGGFTVVIRADTGAVLYEEESRSEAAWAAKN